MGRQELVERIISDAEAESQAIIAEAEKTAQRIVCEARGAADKQMQQARAEADGKAAAIADSRAATARLDGAKILLSEKRGVIDYVYAEAAKKLASMEKKDYITFLTALLEKYAEEGDEIVLADNFAYKTDLAGLAVVKSRKLKLTLGGAKISGGFILHGKNTDIDLSVEAMIEADRAQHEAEVAAELLR